MKKYLNTPEEVVQALQEGKKVHTDFMEYWCTRGVFFSLNKKDDYICINSNISFLHDYMYVEEPEPLKLEVGKFYRLRNGRKAIVANVDEDISRHPAFVAVIGGGNNSYWVSKTGKYSSCSESEWDLVAPWEE